MSGKGRWRVGLAPSPPSPREDKQRRGGTLGGVRAGTLAGKEMVSSTVSLPIGRTATSTREPEALRSRVASSSGPPSGGLLPGDVLGSCCAGLGPRCGLVLVQLSSGSPCSFSGRATSLERTPCSNERRCSRRCCWCSPMASSGLMLADSAGVTTPLRTSTTGSSETLARGRLVALESERERRRSRWWRSSASSAEPPGAMTACSIKRSLGSESCEARPSGGGEAQADGRQARRHSGGHSGGGA